jgi:hypothetical protein
MKESAHRRRQSKQGASLAYSLPLKTIGVTVMGVLGLIVVVLAAQGV